MKYSIALILAISLNAQATDDYNFSDYDEIKQDQDQHQSQKAEAKSYSSSGAIAGSLSASKNKTGDITIIDNEAKQAAASAAAIITANCAVGASGQTRAGGFAVTNSDQFCQYLQMASVHINAYIMHNAENNTCFQTKESQTFICPAQGRAKASYDRYTHFVMLADSLLDDTSFTAWLERSASQILKPLGLAGLLIFLI